MTVSRTVAGAVFQNRQVAMDAAGNAYIAASTDSMWYPVRNSIATCGTSVLSVFAPDGSLLQSTYIPGGASSWYSPFAVGPGSTVFVSSQADATFTPTQAGPFAASGDPNSGILIRLSPQDGVQTFPLACIANSATAGTGPIAAGAMVTMIGNGLGPEQGIQTQATMQTPFPTETNDVEVTFDGTPAPLLWVQDAQVNAIAPWSLTPGQTTNVCVFYKAAKTNCLDWPVVQAAPGVFTVDGSMAAALNQDGTVNSKANPAPLGSIVSIFATGLGPINPSQADGSVVGLPLPVNTLTVDIGLVVCPESPFPPHVCTDPGPGPISYAGPAPFEVAGASQINFQANTHSGMALTVVLPNGQGAASNMFNVHVADQ
ncbi:MAG: IPT/TIG domain-containing protein [Bryobacteraceae bacterium]